MQNTPVSEQKEQKKQKKSVKKEVWSWIRELALALVVVFVIRSFFFKIITVEGGSMLETLRDGDRLYVSILTPKLQGYERGDIVICYYPGRDDRCVKRVIGLPGDTVEVVFGQVFVNGEAIEEDYLTHEATYNYPETTLAEDEYFLLGDNRPISHDSHSADVGPVSRIEGKVRFVLWPLSRFGSIESPEK